MICNLKVALKWFPIENDLLRKKLAIGPTLACKFIKIENKG